jgi:transposase InsO family protein
MNENLKKEIVINALNMAIIKRKPKAGLIFHSDRGSQYASDDFIKETEKYGIIRSMSRKGNCWDNAVSESFFHTLKVEEVYG